MALGERLPGASPRWRRRWGAPGHSLGRKWVTFMVGDTRLPFLVLPFLLRAMNMPG